MKLFFPIQARLLGRMMFRHAACTRSGRCSAQDSIWISADIARATYRSRIQAAFLRGFLLRLASQGLP